MAAVRRIAKYQVDWCKKIVWTLRGVCVFVEGANLCSIRNIEEHWIFEIFATIRTIMGHIRHRIHLSWNIWQTTSVYPEKQSANSMALSVEEKVKQLKKWKFHRKDESFTEKINVSGKIKCSLKRSKLLRNAKQKLDNNIFCSQENFHFHFLLTRQYDYNQKPWGEERWRLGPSDGNARWICLEIREFTLSPALQPRKLSKVVLIPMSTKIARWHTWLLRKTEKGIYMNKRNQKINLQCQYLADILAELRRVDAQRKRGPLLNWTSYHLLSFVSM